MIGRIKHYFQAEVKSAELLTSLIGSIGALRERSDIIAFSPDNTGVHWLGIKNSTKALFEDRYIALPQDFSNSRLTPKSLKLLAIHIASLNFSKIVFKGFPPYFEKLIRQIKGNNKSVRIFLLFAGPASEYSLRSHQQQIELAVTLAKDGVIEKIGFNKKGLSEAISNIYGVKCERYLVKTTLAKQVKTKAALSGHISKIGVLGSDTFNKNLHTQVIAALQVKEADVYVFNAEKFRYLQSPRIKGIKKHLAHDEFLQVLSEMDINYYICFSESWGQVVTESLGVGVPCLTTSTSGIFDFDNVLEDALVVKDYDDIMAIAKQTNALIPIYEEVSKRGIKYVNELNSWAEKRMIEFLNS